MNRTSVRTLGTPTSRRLSASLLSPLALGAMLVGCTEANPGFEPPEPVCQTGEFFVGQPFTLADASKVDILLVVDNSPGMLPNQRAFAAAMPQFVNQLNADEDLDWRVAVISTDVSDQGVPQTGPAGQEECPIVLPQVVERTTASAGLSLGCNVILGQDGSDFEQGLESARRAVEGGADFLRDDARLVVVFFSDEDDCTAQASLDRADPNNCVWQPEALISANDFGRYFASSARRLSGNPVSVVSIVGPRDNRSYPPGTAPSAACEGFGPALSGNRYITVAETEGVNRYGFAENFCATSYVPIMQRVVEDAIAINDDLLCVSLPMSGEPRSVVVKQPGGDTSTELDSLADYLTLGPTDSCPNGAVAIRADAHTATTGHQVEVRFCTTTDPSAQ